MLLIEVVPLRVLCFFGACIAIVLSKSQIKKQKQMKKLCVVLFGVLLLLNCKKDVKILKSPEDVAMLNKTNEASKIKHHQVENAELVFCLDATGSMSGLIGTAKEKIWDIVSEFAQRGDLKSLKLGMAFYRDRGDDFITKRIDLTTDLDSVYDDLLAINASGGGDTPESVNEALNESVETIQWSENAKTYKTIFIVGDCPPHMDYQDDIKYTESCKKAAKKGITINTIKLGNSCRDAITHFKKMSECTNGDFLQLDQNAKDYVIATPYDDKINKVSQEIDASRLYYGTEEEIEIQNVNKEKSLSIYDKGSVTANSVRAEYKLSKAGQRSAYGTQEIINDYENGKLMLNELSDEKLPNAFKGKTNSEKEQLLKTLSEQRKANTKKLKQLIKDRKDYIKSKEKNNFEKASFSREVIKIMEKQSKAVK